MNKIFVITVRKQYQSKFEVLTARTQKQAAEDVVAERKIDDADEKKYNVEYEIVETELT